jgi:uncharacterized protein (TIGR03435 family)
MDDRLTDDEIKAVLAHELSHARRHDNFTAMLHMAVEAVCWFHPLVWWIGARLLDERERACDEDVLRSGSTPDVYAASILRTCEVCLAAPLPCVTGITGSDLKRRIEVIMRNRPAGPLSLAARAALVALACAALGGPVAIGLAVAPRVYAQAQAPTTATEPPPSFEVASIKANKSGDNRVMLGTQPGGRYVASNVTPFLLIRNSYQMQDFQIIGAPDWIKSERFDINAKGDIPFQNTFFDPRGPNRTQLMVRSLLADRFKLRSHIEKRELPIYNLVLARSDGKLGPKLKVSTSDCGPGRAGGPPPTPPAAGERMRCGMQIGPGLVSGGGVPIGQLLTMLSMNVQRTVIDKTGLTERYDIDFSWTPEQMPARDPNSTATPDMTGASLFTALQEQLGLKLESARGPVDVIIIDSIEHPTED